MTIPAADTAPRLRIRPRHLAPAALFLATVAVFWPAHNHRFVAIDDGTYVYNNAMVTRGLTAEGLRWAFTSIGNAAVPNWHPLTWLSHMLDVQLFGLAPGGHHATSVLIHATSGALLFGVLWALTGAVGRSAAAAALFSLHPLRAESVAWIAERKDVLSGLFFMLTLLAYLRWVRRRQPGRYLAATAALALGLLSKPMLVTLPFVLLLLDFWPLGRLRLPARPRDGAPRSAGIPFSRLFLEKVPLLALSAATSVITLIAQAGAIGRIQHQPFPVRFFNAVHSYVAYLGKAVWPTDLMIFYPRAGTDDPLSVLAAGLLLVAITLVAVLTARSRPYLLTGWLWYLGILVPVIGLVQQSGGAAMADRYTYLPLVGVFVAAAWGLPDLIPGWRHRGKALAALTLAVCLLMASLTIRQVGTMRDDETLYKYMLSVDPANSYALNNLGVALIDQDRLADGAAVLSTLFRPDPRQLSRVHQQRGAQLSMSGKADEALMSYTKALALDPGNTEAARVVVLLKAAGARLPQGAPPSWTPQELLDEEEARIWLKQGDSMAAAEHFKFALGYYRQAVNLKPDLADAWNNLGSCYGRLERHQEAAAAFEKAVAADPGNERARKNLGQARRSLRR